MDYLPKVKMATFKYTSPSHGAYGMVTTNYYTIGASPLTTDCE